MSKPNATCSMRALEAIDRWALDLWKLGAHDSIVRSAPGLTTVSMRRPSKPVQVLM